MIDPVQYAYDKDGYAIIDNFFYDDVCDELHSLAVNHEDIDDVYANEGYHSINFDKDNLPFPILSDIITAIHNEFNILKNLKFERGWAFVYNNTAKGVTPHADPASINVNLWVTPYECVKDRTKNGLIIYDKKSPEDWTWDEYNSDVERVTNYLKESNAKPRHIPYQYNRLLIFDSKYFHRTCGVSMWGGKRHRRVNYTFMFTGD